MRIVCPQCGFARTTDPERIPERTVSVTCPKCATSFPFPPGDGEQPGSVAAADAGEAEAVSAQETLPGAADVEEHTTAAPESLPLSATEARKDAAAIPKAGFWIRVVAALVDSVLLSLCQGLLSLLLLAAGGLGGDPGTQGAIFGLVQLFGMVLSVAYYVFFTGYCGQTPGKMALRIRVIRCDGSSIGYGRAFLREFPGKFLSALLLGAGYLMVAFDPQKQGLHDKIANTYVIKL